MAPYHLQNSPAGEPYGQIDAHTHNGHDPANSSASAGPDTATANYGDVDNTVAGLPRKCSVRACMTVTPADSNNKMCDECRARHRTYAMTKRAKRKMEKESINQQSKALLSNEQPLGVVWLPEAPASDDDDGEEEISQMPKESIILQVRESEVTSDQPFTFSAAPSIYLTCATFIDTWLQRVAIFSMGQYRPRSALSHYSELRVGWSIDIA